MKRPLSVIGGAFAAIALTASQALAAPLTASDLNPVKGQTIVVSGAGCAGGVRVVVKWDGETIKISSTRPDGTWDAQFEVPWTARLGDHIVRARCWDGDETRYFAQIIDVTHELSGPNWVRAGQWYTFHGTGCTPDSDVIVTFRGYFMGEVFAGGEGAYSFTLRIPWSAGDGRATIAARCNQPGTDVLEVDRRVVMVY